jgi:UDP-N-acetyl-D-glucosamine dehydrogenase
MLGLAYKKEVDDIRESPSIEIMELLRERGAIINYSDPYVPHFPRVRHHEFDLSSITITQEALRSYNCVILVTAHQDFNYELIANASNLIVDTCGAFRQFKNINIIRA